MALISLESLVLSCLGCRDILADVPCVKGQCKSFAVLGLGGECWQPLESREAAGFLPKRDFLAQAFPKPACKQPLWSEFMPQRPYFVALIVSPCWRRLGQEGRFPSGARDGVSLSPLQSERLQVDVRLCSHNPLNISHHRLAGCWGRQGPDMALPRALQHPTPSA